MKDPKQTKLKIIVGVAALALLVLALAYANHGRVDHEHSSTTYAEYETAEVVEVLADNTAIDPNTENVRRGTMELTVRLLTGQYAGELAPVTNYLSAMYNVYPQAGDRISVHVSTTAEGYEVSVYNYDRSIWVWVFVAVFVLVLILVGGRSGVSAVLGLGYTMVSFLFILVPLIQYRGWPAVPTTLLLITLTALVSFVFIGGVQPKTVVAAVGTLGGVAAAGFLAWAAGKIVHISGLNMDEAESLLLTACDNGLKVKSLFVCGILIAAEGAVMDIAMSISSAVAELHSVNPRLSARELFRSGMNIGRDAMGTMANTLVLAFAGTSLNMMIFICSYQVSYLQLINTDFVAIELIRSLAGSMGIILSVPLVAFLASVWMGRGGEKLPASPGPKKLPEKKKQSKR